MKVNRTTTLKSQGSFPTTRAIRWRGAWVWGLAGGMALAVAAAGCGTIGAPPGRGGLPAREAARISLAVSQTRAQFPQFSGGEIPHTTRQAASPQGAEEMPPRRVLKGSGVEVRPGIQTGIRTRADIEVFLAKPGYDQGWVEVSLPEGDREKWPILAFDHQGEPEGVFEFIFVLASKAGEVRYLVVIGGPYPKNDGERFGMEGTLIFPGPPPHPEAWQRAYKFDFGFAAPFPPEYQPLVAEADRIFQRLPRDLSTLEDFHSRITRMEQPRPGTGGAATLPPATLEANLQEARKNFSEVRAPVEKNLLRYYRLRERIAESYAAFTESNLYTWMPPASQQAYFKVWREGTRHHPKIDLLTEKARGLMESPAGLDAARTSALGNVRRFRNDERDPSPPQPAAEKR